jgi:SAM-dependent methyltransferase
MKRFLNVGGGSKDVPVPDYYAGWQHELAETDPTVGADYLVDPRDLSTLPADTFDAVYGAHVLEHYYPHDARKILKGVRHVLKPDGFAEFRTINIAAVMKEVVEKKLDMNDTLYRSDVGNVTVKDAIYGFHADIEESGEEYFAHRSGFTPRSLADFLQQSGFFRVIVAGYAFNLLAYAFRAEPTAEHNQLLKLPS